MNQKNLQIESLRAIGLLIIPLFHFICFISGEHTANRFENMHPFVREWGLIGVGLFFIISGYFLFPPQTTGTGKFAPKSYIVSKIYKLWIPYTLSIVLLWIFFRTGINPNYMPSVKELLINSTGLAPVFGTRYIDGAHWYMIQLGAFIILAIIIRYSGFKLLYAIPTYFVICMTMYFFSKQSEHNNLLLLICGQYRNTWNFVNLMLGICLKQFFYTSSKREKNLFLSYIIILCISLYFFYAPPYWYTITAASSIIVLFTIFSLCVTKKITILENKPLVFIGSISFYVYLMHQRVGYTIIHYLRSFVGDIIAITAAILTAILLGIFLKYIHQKIIVFSKRHQGIS